MPHCDQLKSICGIQGWKKSTAAEERVDGGAGVASAA